MVHYHHIIPYSKVHRHDVDNIVLLCPNCHGRYHAGLYPVRVFEKDINAPYNSIYLSTHDFFAAPKSENSSFSIGGNTCINTPILLEVNNERIIWVKYDDEGYLLFNAKFYNRNGKLIAEVNDNEWIAYINDGLWDFTYSNGVLKINSDPNKVDLRLNIKESGIELSCNMLVIGVPFVVQEDSIIFGNQNIALGNQFKDCRCAFSFYV